MRRTIEKTVIQTETECLCDICGAITDKLRPCEGCGKELCFHCATDLEYDLWADCCHTDYPDALCESCSVLMDSYGPLVCKIRQDADAAITAARTEWIGKCKEKK